MGAKKITPIAYNAAKITIIEIELDFNLIYSPGFFKVGYLRKLLNSNLLPYLHLNLYKIF